MSAKCNNLRYRSIMNPDYDNLYGHQQAPSESDYRDARKFVCKQYKKSIGIGVPVKYWNDSKKRARTTADFKEGNEINDEIDRWEEIGKRTVKYFTDSRISPCCERICR